MPSKKIEPLSAKTLEANQSVISAIIATGDAAKLAVLLGMLKDKEVHPQVKELIRNRKIIISALMSGSGIDNGIGKHVGKRQDLSSKKKR